MTISATSTNTSTGVKNALAVSIGADVRGGKAQVYIISLMMTSWLTGTFEKSRAFVYVISKICDFPMTRQNVCGEKHYSC